jgi:hypothetical protein
VKVSVWLVDPRRHSGVLRDGDDPAVGIFLSASAEILIDWSIPHDSAEQTLMHELAHADEYFLGHDHDHATLNAITSCQWATLKRNGYLRFPPRPVTPHDRRRARAAARKETAL